PWSRCETLSQWHLPMRAALEVLRALQPGQSPSQAGKAFLEGLAAKELSVVSGLKVGHFRLEDAAVLTQRFAQHVPQPPQSFFCEVIKQIEPPLHRWAQERTIACPVSRDREEEASPITGTTAVVLADAFARSRCYDGSKLLGMVCLATPPTLPLSPVEVLQFTQSLTLLGASSFHNPSVRGFLLMRLKIAAEQMDGSSLAQCAKHLADAGLYSPEVSEEVARQLAGNPWSFTAADLQCLLPHFGKWKLGELQKKAFHTLGRRFAEHAELLTPTQALQVIETFTDIGNVHEVALQTLFLRLLLERSFIELGVGVARLAASMSKVQHYHTGLLREIIAYIQEEPEVLRTWAAADLSGTLRSMGLAPVRVPSAIQVLVGCRYSALLPNMNNSDLKDLFEISGWHPEVLRGVVLRAGRVLMPRLSAAQEWGPRACVDAALGLVLAADVGPKKAFSPCHGCACGAAGQSASLSPNKFRTEQPEWQLQVVLRAARSYKQRGLRQTVARPEMPLKGSSQHLFFHNEPAAQILPIAACQAPWSLTQGRRHRRLKIAPVLAAMLGEVFPLLLGRLRELSQALSELPGAAMPNALIEGLPPPLESVGGPLPPSRQILSEENILAPPALLPAQSEWWEDAAASTEGVQAEIAERELETMRRSEMLQVCVQTLAVMQLFFSAGSSSQLSEALPRETLLTLARLVPMVNYLLRPRRDDPIAQRFQLGPLRIEAFVRRPDERMQQEVYKVLQNMIPFIPRFMGWETWDLRPQDTLNGEETGGAFMTLQRDLEIPPFIVCLVLKREHWDLHFDGQHP
ncbi:Extended synaptotagmin-3, partial [Durusdinium trenchii]